MGTAIPMPLHPRTRAKTKILTRLILELLGGGAVITVGLGMNPRTAGKLPLALIVFGAARVREALKRLRLQGCVRYDARDSRTPVVLTKRGMARISRLQFRDILEGKRRWDYLWRVVLFDIPERLRPLRSTLVYDLTMARFFPLQKSVFVCPFPCEKEVRELCARLRIRKYVIFATTASLGKDEERVWQHFFSRASSFS